MEWYRLFYIDSMLQKKRRLRGSRPCCVPKMDQNNKNVIKSIKKY